MWRISTNKDKHCWKTFSGIFEQLAQDAYLINTQGSFSLLLSPTNCDQCQVRSWPPKKTHSNIFRNHCHYSKAIKSEEKKRGRVTQSPRVVYTTKVVVVVVNHQNQLQLQFFSCTLAVCKSFWLWLMVELIFQIAIYQQFRSWTWEEFEVITILVGLRL